MAIFHLSVKRNSRAFGRSAVSAAAYRSGEKLNAVNSSAYRSGEILECEKHKTTHNYTHRKDVVLSEIMLPSHAPKEYFDRSTLWPNALGVRH